MAEYGQQPLENQLSPTAQDLTLDFVPRDNSWLRQGTFWVPGIQDKHLTQWTNSSEPFIHIFKEKCLIANKITI